jgi:hypothetical protein
VKISVISGKKYVSIISQVICSFRIDGHFVARYLNMTVPALLNYTHMFRFAQHSSMRNLTLIYMLVV